MLATINVDDDKHAYWTTPTDQNGTRRRRETPTYDFLSHSCFGKRGCILKYVHFFYKAHNYTMIFVLIHIYLCLISRYYGVRYKWYGKTNVAGAKRPSWANVGACINNPRQGAIMLTFLGCIFVEKS